MQLKALLLDLDGTLVDTAPDMVATLNRVLHRHGEPNVELDTAGKLVSNGARALLEFGFRHTISDADMAQLIAEFLADYADHVADQSVFYSGITDCLELCAEANIPWGVVTNKPLELSRSLLDGLERLSDCRILLGGDSLPVKKPNPAPLLHCCMALQVAASESLYVGDHERDIIAGNAAGMDTAAAIWGYIPSNEDPTSWGGDYLLHNPASLFTLLEERLAYRLHATKPV